jgi:hypothetical protein
LPSGWWSLRREGKVEVAKKEPYAADAINIEQCGTPTFPEETKGLSAIISEQFTSRLRVQITARSPGRERRDFTAR